MTHVLKYQKAHPDFNMVSVDHTEQNSVSDCSEIQKAQRAHSASRLAWGHPWDAGAPWGDKTRYLSAAGICFALITNQKDPRKKKVILLISCMTVSNSEICFPGPEHDREKTFHSVYPSVSLTVIHYNVFSLA